MGRLLRKVEKMRCIRSSMQNIFNQLQTNDDELQTIAHRMDDIKENTEIKEEEPQQNSHNNHNHQRDERKKLRQQRLLRFTKTHKNNKSSYLHPFIPRICSTPHCNHPARGRPICCRGCLTKEHSPTCTQRALKMIKQRRTTNTDNDIDNELQYIPLTSPQLIRTNTASNHSINNNPQSLILPPSMTQHRQHRNRSHSQSNLFETNRRKNSHRSHRRSHSSAFKYLYCDQCRLRFHSLTELDRHKAVHHSPAFAVSLRPRMPPPIPELTSSYHTTMPSLTKKPFRYKQSNNSLPILLPNDDSNDDEDELAMNANTSSMSMSRLNVLRRHRKNKQNDRHSNDDFELDENRKRRPSLSQLFSTLLPRRNNNQQNVEQKEQEQEEQKEDDLNIRRRRSLVSHNS